MGLQHSLPRLSYKKTDFRKCKSKSKKSGTNHGKIKSGQMVNGNNSTNQSDISGFLGACCHGVLLSVQKNILTESGRTRMR